MDPWLADGVSEKTRETCQDLVADKPELYSMNHPCISYTRTRDDECRLIGEALKRNTALEVLTIAGPDSWFDGRDFDADDLPVFSSHAANSLALAIASHPTLRELHFEAVKFANFGVFAQAFLDSTSLNYLEFYDCYLEVTEEVYVYIELLLKRNAVVECLKIECCHFTSSGHLEISSEAFLHNESLKELVIIDKMSSDQFISDETVDGIACMLIGNRSIERLELGLWDSRFLSQIMGGAYQHPSLKSIS